MKKVLYEPMDDGDIKHYLPNANLVIYSSLKGTDDIETLLPVHKSYCILLYPVQSESSGHWVVLTRFNDVIEYSDSYGNAPDVPLSWYHEPMHPYLTDLLNKTKLQVVLNTIAFQDKKDNRMSTCGAFAVFRVLTMIEGDLNIEGNNKLLKQLKKESSESYDNVVVKYINYR
jgi:hypothetical protein